ncbi:N-acetyltransferase [Oxalobacteraceae bacterium OM1]|nr:N-acetyltransferase [Oxalobacteraceae bacterium OM1]
MKPPAQRENPLPRSAAKATVFEDIVTQRCRLRPFQFSDLEPFVEYRKHPEVARYQSWTTYSYAQALMLFADLSSKAFGLHGEWYQIAVADRHSDALIGDVAVHFSAPLTAEIGFTIAPQHQGRGYAREGVAGMLDYLLGDLGLQCVRATTDVRNVPSIGVLASLGFERLADAPRQVTFKGQPGEEYDYYQTRQDWLKQGTTRTPRTA